MPKTICPLCQQQAQVINQADFSWYECATCGAYGIGLRVEGNIKNESPIRRAALSACARELYIRGDRAIFLYKVSGPLHQISGIPIEINDVMNAAALPVADRLGRILLNYAKLNPKVGASFKVIPRRDYPLARAEESTEFDFLLKQLAASDLIREVGSDIDSDASVYQITVPGWNRIADLQRGSVQKPNQAFVAMAFDPSLMDVRTHGLKAGIVDAGYKPLLIDEKEHNNDIHDEILSEIRKSHFVVADFTLQRPNVYFEAGFAEALGLPVIYTCREDDITKAHFDIRQRNHIVWTAPEELRDRLKNRIGATIGSPKS